MYSLGEIKQKAKRAFNANYWKSVAVCFIVSAISGMVAGTGGTNIGKSALQSSGNADSIANFFENIKADPELLMAIIAAATAGLVLAGIITAAIRIFLINPFRLGQEKYFVENAQAPAEVGAILAGFKNNSYIRNVGGLLLRDLFEGLGYVVCVIPGIILKYAFYLVPYILADYPDIKAMDAIRLSCAKMKGYKWKAFVLELSFIGWDLLTLCTCGLIRIFYVGPYRAQTRAEFYLKVRELT